MKLCFEGKTKIMLLRTNLILCIVISISGCSSNPTKLADRGTTLSDRSIQMVSQDFVSVLVQVPTFSPPKTRFIITGSNNSLTESLNVRSFTTRISINGRRRWYSGRSGI